MDAERQAELQLARVRKLIVDEIRRLSTDDVTSGRRAYRQGVMTARMVHVKQLTYILDAAVTTDSGSGERGE